MSGAGCLGLGGGDDEEQIGRHVTDSQGGEYAIMRVDFVDQAGTLGQVDHMSNDKEIDNIVNNHSEEDWQEMNDNDLDNAERILEKTTPASRKSGRGWRTHLIESWNLMLITGRTPQNRMHRMKEP